jgi:hypothetical protein
MFKMPSYMVYLKRRYSCINLQVTRIVNTTTMCASWKRPFMDSNKLHAPGMLGCAKS